jgi:hypothetical protein
MQTRTPRLVLHAIPADVLLRMRSNAHILIFIKAHPSTRFPEMVITSISQVVIVQHLRVFTI